LSIALIPQGHSNGQKDIASKQGRIGKLCNFSNGFLGQLFWKWYLTYWNWPRDFWDIKVLKFTPTQKMAKRSKVQRLITPKPLIRFY